MQFKYLPLSKTQEAEGVVVVIDVLRAFTTAAYAFSIGAEKIYPVGSIKEAIRLKDQIPGSLIMGEEKGIKPDGFDFGNSPSKIIKQDLSNKTLIQRTSAGTQGLVRAQTNKTLIAASFVVAKATGEYLYRLAPEMVSFIITGNSLGRDGDEDQACAEYIAGLIRNKNPHPEKFTKRILTSTVGQSFVKGEIHYLSEKDLILSGQVNLFDFVMVVSKEKDLLVMGPKYSKGKNPNWHG